MQNDGNGYVCKMLAMDMNVAWFSVTFTVIFFLPNCQKRELAFPKEFIPFRMEAQKLTSPESVPIIRMTKTFESKSVHGHCCSCVYHVFYQLK